MISMKNAALAYCKQNGERPPLKVFPCIARGKEPLTNNGFHAASSDKRQINEWWDKNPHANIGIPTGAANGIVVIDVDNDKDAGKDGNATLDLLQADYGILPPSWEALTGGGGRHLFFAYPQGHCIRSGASSIPMRNGQKAQFVDVRAEGGYIIAAPSIHPNGRAYTWEVSSEPSGNKLAALPAAWIAALEQSSSFQNSDKFTLPETIEEGKRNETLFKYAASLRAKSIKPTVILKSLYAENMQRCKPPLAGKEIEAAFNSALKYPEGTAYETIVNANQQSSARATIKDRITIEALEEEAKAYGFEIKLDVIANEIVVAGSTNDGIVHTPDSIVTYLHSELAGRYKGCTMDTLSRYLAYIADKNRYNPVLDYLESNVYDGGEHFDQACTLLGIENDKLSCTLFYKWLWQGLALLHNNERDPFGADGVLTLQGAQGIGKTQFFAHLALRTSWFGEGQCVNDRDKDTTRRVITKWISELGEVESTLKSDVESLKNFVTSSFDEYRLPYGHCDKKNIRHTNLCATCNSDRYLIDTSGNRRWWTIPITRSPLKRSELTELDATQLWLEIAAKTAKADLQGFRLSIEEREALAARNGEREKLMKGEAEVLDCLAAAEYKAGYTITPVTISEWQQQNDVLKKYSVEQIGRVLTKHGYNMTHIRTENGKRARTYQLPMFSYHNVKLAK